MLSLGAILILFVRSGVFLEYVMQQVEQSMTLSVPCVDSLFLTCTMHILYEFECVSTL